MHDNRARDALSDGELGYKAKVCDDESVCNNNRLCTGRKYSVFKSVEACLEVADAYAGIPQNGIKVEPNEKRKKAYIKRAMKQIDSGFRGVGGDCSLPQWARHGEIIASMRKEIHQCLMENASKEKDYIYELNTEASNIQERINYYQRTKMSKERIVENLKKDYALMTEFYETACKDVETHITNEYYQKACSMAYNIYANGANYEDVQVYAPRPEKAALLAPIAQKIATYNKEIEEYNKAEEARRLAEEKRAEAEYERERKIEEAKKAKRKAEMQARHKRFTAPIAKDCQGKFKNKEICHIFKNTLLNDMLFQEDSLDEQSSVKFDLLEYVGES